MESRFAYSVLFRLRSASLRAAFNLHFPYRSPVPPTLLIPVHKFISSKFIHAHKYSDSTTVSAVYKLYIVELSVDTVLVDTTV